MVGSDYNVNTLSLFVFICIQINDFYVDKDKKGSSTILNYP